MLRLRNAEDIFNYVQEHAFDPTVAESFNKWYIDTCKVLDEVFINKDKVAVLLFDDDSIASVDPQHVNNEMLFCVFFELDKTGKAVKILTGCGLETKDKFITGLSNVEFV